MGTTTASQVQSAASSSGDVITRPRRRVMLPYLTEISRSIFGALERAFYSYGKTVAQAPVRFILLCLAFTACCCVGITKFTEETHVFKLWTPENCEFLEIMGWVEKHLPSDLRMNMVIYEAENVLDKNVLLEMLRVHETIVNTTTRSATWNRVCVKVPKVTFSIFGRRKRHIMEILNSGSDFRFIRKSLSKRDLRLRRRVNDSQDDDEALHWSERLPRNMYCEILESLEQVCLENSILEVFGYNRHSISSLTQEDIIEKINTIDKSAVTGLPLNVTVFLRNVERDAAGQIIKAGVSRQTWFTKVNRTAVEKGDYIEEVGVTLDTSTYEWELMSADNIVDNIVDMENASAYVMAQSSFGKASNDNTWNDLKYISLGVCVMFVYVIIMLGKFNMVEQRPILSLLGLSCVGLAVGVSYGICSTFGVFAGHANGILPFLFLGLGVDDMFVIMQAWNNLSPREQKLELSERIGYALKHAGVSITVTSVTDFVAFAVGSTTVLPALRSFCLYAAVGTIAIYFFQATFFVACLAVDQRRLEDTRHGLLWCWKLKNWTPNKFSRKDLCQTFFTEVYAKFLFQLPVKVLVLVVTVALACVSGWGLSNLRQKYDYIWFLPQDSQLYKYYLKERRYYPFYGTKGSIYFGNTSIFSEMSKLEELSSQLHNSTTIAAVDSWYDKYKRYWKKQGYQVPDPQQTEGEFLDQLSQFLYSRSGLPYRHKNFRFSSDFHCTEKAPAVTASSIDYWHTVMSSSSEQIQAMDDIKTIVRDMNFTGYVRAWSYPYGTWETNRVITAELYRNMGLALAVVFVVTLLLIASLVTSLMVVMCVVLTLVDVGALMHWWGLTIDPVSCLGLVMIIGLCVDYAAHVGHTFMTKVGTRDERAKATVATIGPAVLNGSFSTFLSFVFLANSGSYVFSTFFKIFFSMSVYGLYHGLVFLPVMLSLLGPAPYISVPHTAIMLTHMSSSPTTSQTEVTETTTSSRLDE